MRFSSERRKKPRTLGSGVARLDAKVASEMSIMTEPWGVKPNSSKRIIGRESAVIFKFLISAMDDEIKERRRRRSNDGDRDLSMARASEISNGGRGQSEDSGWTSF